MGAISKRAAEGERAMTHSRPSSTRLDGAPVKRAQAAKGLIRKVIRKGYVRSKAEEHRIAPMLPGFEHL